MTSLADALFQAGLIPQVEAVHGELITMLSGDDAGRTYTGVISLEQDLVFNGDIGEDRRAKRTISFMGASVPRITSHATLRDGRGLTWKAIRMPGDAYLSTDFELVAVTASDT
jgi:hypothetical protein